VEILLFIPFMIALLLGKAFFSGSEIALVSSDKLKLRSKADHGDKGARIVLNLFRKPESLLATTLIGTNVCTMMLAIFGTALMIELFGSGGDLYATLLLTPIMLIFGEIVPKSVFQQRANVIAPAVARPLALLQTLLMPVVVSLGWIGRKIAARIGPQGVVISPFVTRRRLRLMLESAERLAESQVLDRDRIQRAIQLSDMTVGEAMIPLAKVAGARSSISMAELVELSRKAGHRRIPLYDGNISNIVAIACWSIWDEIDPGFLKRSPDEFTVAAHFTSSIQRLDELLPVLLSRTDHMAVAVDEFGTAVGIVTVEDLMTILLGSVAQGIHPRHHSKQPGAVVDRQGDDILLMDASTPLAEIGELLDIGLPTREFHTVGGLLTSRLRRIPAVGDTLEEAGYRFTVIEATTRAPTRIKVEALPL
jgi:CBS domain containing-hemolysin-like protein